MPSPIRDRPNKRTSNKSNKSTVVDTEVGPVRVPASARTRYQKIAWLLHRGLVWGAYLLMRHSDKAFLELVQRAHPDIPFKNAVQAARLGGL